MCRLCKRIEIASPNGGQRPVSTDPRPPLPIRYGNGPNMAALANEIDESPVLLSLLQVGKRYVRQLATSEPATEQDSKNGAVAFAFNVSGSGLFQKRRASSAVSQLPNLTPS